MQVEVKERGVLGWEIEGKVSAERLAQQLQEKLMELTKKVRLPGFRAGKIPIRVVKDKYSGSVRKELLDELVQKSFDDAVKQHRLGRLATYPKVKILTGGQEGEALHFIIELEVLPEINLPKLTELKVEKKITEITDEVVERQLQQLIKQFALWKPQGEEYVAKKGDQLIVDFTIYTEEGKETKTENAKVVLGDGETWKEFEDQLYGLKAKIKQEFRLDIPTTHVDAALAGKNCRFEVVIKEIAILELPELNDQLVADKFGFKDVVELKKVIRTNLEQNLQTQIANRFMDAVLEKLEQAVTFTVPPGLIDEEVRHLEKQPNSKAADAEQLRDKATTKLRRDLLARAMIEMTGLVIKREEVERQLFEAALMMKQDRQAAKQEYGRLIKDQQVVDRFAGHLLESKLSSYLLEHVQTEEVAVAYDLFIKGE